MSKRWPLEVISFGLLVDADTPAPHIDTVQPENFDAFMPADVGGCFGLSTNSPGEVPKQRCRAYSYSSDGEFYPGCVESSFDINTPSPDDIATPVNCDVPTHSSLIGSPISITKENVVGINFDPAAPSHTYWSVGHQQTQIINRVVASASFDSINPRLLQIDTKPQGLEIVFWEPIPSRGLKDGSTEVLEGGLVDPNWFGIGSEHTDVSPLRPLVSAPEPYPTPQYFPYEEIIVQPPPYEELQYDDYLVSAIES